MRLRLGDLTLEVVFEVVDQLVVKLLAEKMGYRKSVVSLAGRGLGRLVFTYLHDGVNAWPAH